MRNFLKVDEKNRRLIMDRMFDRNRRIVGSEEYNILQRAKADYPQFNLVLRHIKSNPEKQIYKHLTYEYMREYIIRHTRAKERMEEFEEMTLRSRCHVERYAKVKAWFLAAYPDISDFTPEQFKEIQERVNPIENYEVMESVQSLPLAS
jgi:hypothetical protein